MRGPLAVAAVLICLNQLDGMLTLLWVHMGIAEEANVLWGDMVHQNPVAFMAAKVGLVSLGTYLLYRQAERPLAWLGLRTCAVAYVGISLWHMRVGALVL